jgi:hypothetical protein
MDDEQKRQLEKAMRRPSGLAAAQEFLQTYVFDAELDQLEGGVKHMMATNPATIISGVDGLAEVLEADLPPGTLAALVSRDANRYLSDPSDEAARAWLMRLLQSLRQWTE